MQYKKLFIIPVIVLALFSTGCVVQQGGNMAKKESFYPNINDFPFEISTIYSNKNKENYQIKIINKQNHKIQIIDEGKPFEHPRATDLLKILDLNNDGYADILSVAIYPSLQNINRIYIFEPKTQQFVERMEDISYEGEIKSLGKGCIKVEYITRNGSYYLDPEKFCWSNGKWKSSSH